MGKPGGNEKDNGDKVPDITKEVKEQPGPSRPSGNEKTKGSKGQKRKVPDPPVVQQPGPSRRSAPVLSEVELFRKYRTSAEVASIEEFDSQESPKSSKEKEFVVERPKEIRERRYAFHSKKRILMTIDEEKELFSTLADVMAKKLSVKDEKVILTSKMRELVIRLERIDYELAQGVVLS